MTDGHQLGFRSLDNELPPVRLPVQGTFPAWLAGSLLRTGPAKFEAGSHSYRHWFDGLAMLHRFGFGGGEVTYANRFLDSLDRRRALPGPAASRGRPAAAGRVAPVPDTPGRR